MSSNIKRNSEFIWNIVGILSAILLLLYIVTTFLGVRVDKIIPISGDAAPVFQETSAPTTLVVTNLVTFISPDNTLSPLVPPSSITSATVQLITATNTAIMTPTPVQFPPIITGYGPEWQYTLHKLQPEES